jgi:hypothetical protein
MGLSVRSLSQLQQQLLARYRECIQRWKSVFTFKPAVSRMIPSGAYVFPVTLYSAVTGPRCADLTTHTWPVQSCSDLSKDIFRTPMCHFANVKMKYTRYAIYINSPKTYPKLTFEIDIIFVVNVPVLSLQITVVQPSVSTDVKVRTIAFNFAILLVPSAKQLKITKTASQKPQHYNQKHLQTTKIPCKMLSSN